MSEHIKRPIYKRAKFMVYLITLAAAALAEIRQPGSQFASQLAGAVAVALPVLLAAEGAIDYKGVQRP